MPGLHEVRQGVPRAYESVRDVRGSSQKSEGIHKYLRESEGVHIGQTETTEVRRSSWRSDGAHRGLTEDRGNP